MRLKREQLQKRRLGSKICSGAPQAKMSERLLAPSARLAWHPCDSAAEVPLGLGAVGLMAYGEGWWYKLPRALAL